MVLKDLEIRPLRAGDRSAARELADGELAQTPYGEIPASALTTALDGGSNEARGLAAIAEGEMTGLVLFGLVAGAVGTGRLHLVAVTASARLRGVASALIDAAVAELKASGARVAFVEMPDDPRLRPALSLLTREGFAEEARVADFFRDGVSLVVLRREIG